MNNTASRFLCGFGKAEITPPAKMYLNGQFYRRIAESTHDPLYATAAALGSEGKKPTVIVSIDIVSIDAQATEKIAALIAGRVPGFERGQLMCCAIHTHTAPFLTSDYDVYLWGEAFRINEFSEGMMTPEDYREKIFIPRVAQACIDALADMCRAGLSVALGHAVIGHCRRVVYRDGSSVMYGATDKYEFDFLEGGNDSSVEWLCVFDDEKRLRGVLFNVACPAQVVEHESFYSADYVGAFRMQLAEKFGRDIPTVAMIGAAGDQSPRDLVRRRGRASRAEPNMWNWEGAHELGRRLLNSLEYEYEKLLSDIRTEIEYESCFEVFELPLRTVTDEQAALAREKYDAYLEKYNGNPLAFSDEDRKASSLWAGILNRAQTQKHTLLWQTPVHIIRLGEASVVSVPFELYLQYGMRIRARSEQPHTLIVELADDSGSYLPTAFAVEAKSYSAMISNCKVSCSGGEILTEKLIEKINGML